MKLQEYVDRYIDMIKIAVKRLYPECDLTSKRSRELLHNEYLVAIQEFENFVSFHRRNPDHCALMDHFERWGWLDLIYFRKMNELYRKMILLIII